MEQLTAEQLEGATPLEQLSPADLEGAVPLDDAPPAPKATASPKLPVSRNMPPAPKLPVPHAPQFPVRRNMPHVLDTRDPSPSDVITLDVEPMFDPTGEIGRVRAAIRKAAPGEDLDSIMRRLTAEEKAEENANNPFRDDWLAQSIVESLALGPVIGLATKAGGALLKGAGNTAIDRIATRELDSISRGASNPLRKEVRKVVKDAKDLLKTERPIVKAKGEAEKVKAVDGLIDRLNAENDAIYSRADAASLERQAVPLPISEPATARVAHEYVGPYAERLIAEKANAPLRSAPMPAPDENLTTKILAPRAIEAEMAPKPVAPASPAQPKIPDPSPGVTVGDIVAAREKSIARLKKGTTADKETADALQSELDLFTDTYGTDKARRLTGREVRAEASALQSKGYRREATTPAKRAARQSSKDVLDVLGKHVADPADAAKLAENNRKITAAKRLKNVLEDKITIAETPGQPLPTGVGRGGFQTLVSKPVMGVVRGAGNAADHALAGLAAVVRAGHRPNATQIDKAIAAGVKASTIRALMSRLPNEAD